MDYVRYDGYSYCFCAKCQNKYKEIYGRDLLNDYFDKFYINEEIRNDIRNFRENNIYEYIINVIGDTKLPVGAFIFPVVKYKENERPWYEEVGQNLGLLQSSKLSWILPMIYPEHTPSGWGYKNYMNWEEAEIAISSMKVNDINYIYPVFEDNPRGIDSLPTLEDYQKTISLANGFGGCIYYSNNDLLLTSKADTMLSNLATAFNLNITNNVTVGDKFPKLVGENFPVSCP